MLLFFYYLFFYGALKSVGKLLILQWKNKLDIVIKCKKYGGIFTRNN